MANKTIPQLPSASSIDENTLFPVDSGTQTFKATSQVVANFVAGLAEKKANTQLKKLVISNWSEVQNFSNIGTDWPDHIQDIAFCKTTGHCVAVSANLNSVDQSIIWATKGLKNWAMSNALVSGVAKSWRRVIWVESLSRFYVVGTEKVSGDGSVGWMPQNNPAAGNILTSALGTKPLYDICYAPSLSRMLVVTPASDGTAAMISNDGTSFTSVSTPSGFGFTACEWSPSLGRFVMGGLNQFAFSDNGTDWTGVSVSTDSSMIQRIKWVEDLGLFVASATDASIFTSPDGENWTLSHNEPSTSVLILDFAYSPQLKLLVGVSLGVNQFQTGRIYFSENGLDWDYIQNLPNPETGTTYQAIHWIENQQMFLLGANQFAPFLIAKSLSHPGI